MARQSPLKLPDLRLAWPDRLRPRGEGSFEKEPFGEWWERSQDELSHLPFDLCEQWIYRHWTHSPFRFLDLRALNCERRKFGSEQLLRSVYRAFGGELNPKFDYETFQRRGATDRHPTALALDGGTWDYPMVLLSTPSGIVDGGQVLPEVRLVIVEGHQRHRYLNALHALGMSPSGQHEVFILSSGQLA